MECQLGEAISIARAPWVGSEAVMSSKDKYSRCLIPEMTLTCNGKIIGTNTSNKRVRGTEKVEYSSTKRIRREEDMTRGDERTDRQQADAKAAAAAAVPASISRIGQKATRSKQHTTPAAKETPPLDDREMYATLAEQ